MNSRVVALLFSSAAVLSLAQLPLPLSLSPSLVRGDGVGYYAWLRSPVVDGDFNFENEFSHFEEALPDSELMSTLHLYGPRSETGLINNHWPVGSALLWAPTFIITHAVSELAGLPADGYAIQYQVAVALNSTLFGLAGLWLLLVVLRRFFPLEPSLLALLSVWGASSLTAYMYFMPAWSHAHSFFAITLILYLWLKARESRRLLSLFWLAGACGLAVIVRLQDVFFGAVLVAECLAVWARSRDKLRDASAALGTVLLGGMLAMIPQLAGWQILHGNPFPSAYAPGSEFDWRAPYLWDVLTRPRVGVFTSTPLFLVAVFGIAGLFKRDRLLTTILLGVFLVQLWLIASFNYYDGGASFGPRYFISSLPLAALALAAVYQTLLERFGPWPGRAVVSLLIAYNYLLLALFGFELIRRGSRISWMDIFDGTRALFERLIG